MLYINDHGVSIRSVLTYINRLNFKVSNKSVFVLGRKIYKLASLSKKLDKWRETWESTW